VNSDGKTIAGQHALADGFSGNGAPLVFADTGAIPLGATIDSVQAVVGLSVVHGDDVQVCTAIAGVAGADIGTFDLVGIDAVDFTGTGLYSSAAMTLTPGLGVAWEREDLFGDPLTYFLGNPRGWWTIGTAGNGNNAGALSSFSVDYMALVVVYNSAPPGPPPNLGSSPPFQTPGQWALHRLDVLPRREGPAKS
jgi:hypothetical protein